MGGIGSGPQASPATLIKQAKEEDAKNLPKYFKILSQKALNGDRDCLFYMVDRQLGKAKQQTDIDLKGGESLGIAMVNRIHELVDQRRLDAIQRPELTEGSSQESSTEA